MFRAASGEFHEQNGGNALDDWVTRFLGHKPIVEDAKELELGQMKVEGMRYKLPFRFGNNDAEMSFEAFEVPGHFGNVRYFLFWRK